MKSDGFMMDSITNQNDNTEVIHEMSTGFCWALFCCCPIDLIHKSQNAPIPYPTMLYSEQKCAHFYSEWSIVGYGTGAFWDLWNWSIAIFRSLLRIMQTYTSGLFPWHWRDCRNARDALQWRHNEHNASQISSFTIVYSNVYSGADQGKHQSSASPTFVRGIHRWPVNSPHKGQVRRKMFPFDDVIMMACWRICAHDSWDNM